MVTFTTREEALEILNYTLDQTEEAIKSIGKIQFHFDSGISHLALHNAIAYGKSYAKCIKNMIAEINNTPFMMCCKKQGKDKDGIYCMAHLAEGRALNCPYAHLEYNLSKEKCIEFESMSNDKA